MVFVMLPMFDTTYVSISSLDGKEGRLMSGVLNTHLSIGSMNAIDFEVGDKRVKIFPGSETWR